MELGVLTSLCTTLQFIHLFFRLDLFLMMYFIQKIIIKAKLQKEALGLISQF